MTPKFRAETAGVKFWLSVDVGKKQLRNSVLFEFNFNLLLVVQWNIFWRQYLSWFKEKKIPG